MPLTFGSLFAGIGGFDLGFERAGMKCKWQVEIDPFCQKVLAKHWPSVRKHDDVRTFPPGEPDEWRVDVICGGDPCQENSAARGSGQCTQPSLGAEFIRVIAEIRPRLVLRENPSRVRKDAPWPWHRFRGCFESLGYSVLPFRLRACCLGAKHRRERLFLLAELADAYRERLEGRQGTSAAGFCDQLPRQMEKGNWPNIPAEQGHCSRAGIPDYVGRIRGLGNAVCPPVAEFIGRMIVEHFGKE